MTRNNGYALNTMLALYLPKEICCEGMWTKGNDSWLWLNMRYSGKLIQSEGSRHSKENVYSPKRGILIMDIMLIVVRVLIVNEFNKYICIHTSYFI